MRDKISMSLGKELRPCFLDAKLITSLFKLKKSEQFRGRLGKIFLREIFKNDLKRGIVFAKKEIFKLLNLFGLKKILKNGLVIILKKLKFGTLDGLIGKIFIKI